MTLRSGDYCVEIAIDSTYIIGSTKNKPYDIVLNPDNHRRRTPDDDVFYRAISVVVNSRDKHLAIVIIGGYCSLDTNCAVLDGETLTLMLDNAISQIDIRDGSLLFHKLMDSFGCNLGIYKVHNGYIIHGELDIIMLDFEYNKVWTFAGADTFVSITGKTAFELCEDRIKLNDFNDVYYEIDYHGKLIFDTFNK